MCLGDGKGARQESKPLKLDGSHEETIRHETSQPFKVEWSYGRSIVSQFTDCRGFLLLKLLDLDRDKVVRSIAGSSAGPLFDGRDNLRNRICYSTQNL